MIKVFGLPTPEIAGRASSAGISQVVINVAKHSEEFGFTYVNTPHEADLIAHHAGSGDGRTDVAHCHGMYPTGQADYQKERWHWMVNRRVIRDIRAARPHVTVPSQWVADILRRDMHLEPRVIRWAVDVNEWGALDNMGYVLWNKNRTEGVCDPSFVNLLAEAYPNVKFITTFGEPAVNVKVIGLQPHEVMKEIVRHANVYLATTKETGDIGSREAMASGVPVLGFNHGATAELVEHGVNGFLAEVGDNEGLIAGLDYVMNNRKILGELAYDTVAEDSWRRVAKQFGELYEEALAIKEENPKVSIVIPCHNYAEFVGDAIASAKEQNYENLEIIVVNDASEDNSHDVINQAHPNLFINLTENVGVAEARNVGIKMASGQYIICLDADDKIHPDFVRTCLRSMVNEKSIGIAYTGLRIFNEDGLSDNVNPWPVNFDAELQITGQNRVPSCCMFRREAWEAVGGYRGKYTPAEDAEFWMRVALRGWRAVKVTDQGLFLYRLHGNSLSRRLKEPDWVSDKGFVVHRNLPIACDAQTFEMSPPVVAYDDPMVSVIIPVSTQHVGLLKRSLDSVERQSFTNWEVIVVNDSTEVLHLAQAPYAKTFSTGGNMGASYARNIGIDAARGRFVVFLDADDELHPDFLAKTLAAYRHSGAYIYTDLNIVRSDRVEPYRLPEFDPSLFFTAGSFHGVTVLIPTDIARKVKFDVTMDVYEDVKFFMDVIAVAGLCGKRLGEYLFDYHVEDGYNRQRAESELPKLKATLHTVYGDYIDGKEVPMCSCDTPKKKVDPIESELILASYAGKDGAHEVSGAISGRRYGRRKNGDAFYVDVRDLDDYVRAPSGGTTAKFVPVEVVELPPRKTVMPQEVYS